MLTGHVDAVELPEDLGEATKLTVYVGRQRAGGRPAGATRPSSTCCTATAIAGATVLLGVDGTAHGVRQRARFFGAQRRTSR